MFFDGKKAIIFDFDGTVVDSMGMYIDVDCEIIRLLCGKDVSKDVVQRDKNLFFKDNVEGDIYFKYCEYLKERYGFEESAKEIFETRKKALKMYYLEKLDLKKNVDIVLRRLKELGYVLVMATTSHYYQVELGSNSNLVKNKIDLLSSFDLILTMDDVVNSKPDSEIYLKVIEKLGISKEKCLVFEDSLIGVISAVNAGLEVVNVYDKFSDSEREAIDDITTYKIKSYDEVIAMLD